MTDSTQFAAALMQMMTAGTPERALLVAVALSLPNMSRAELDAALRETTEAGKCRGWRQR